MKNCFKYLLISLLFFSIFYGCDKSNPVSNSTSSQNLIPLARGNTWYYSGVAYDTVGNVRENFGEIHDVRGNTILFGKKLTFYSGSYVTYTDSGLIAYGGYSVSSDAPNDTVVNYNLLYKYPAQTRDSFGYGMKVGTIDTLVNVPAGSFHCIKYMGYSNSVLCYDVYISPGIGVIKVVSYFGANYIKEQSKVSSYMELKSYNLN